VRVNDVAGSAREGLLGMAFGGKDALFKVRWCGNRL